MIKEIEFYQYIEEYNRINIEDISDLSKYSISQLFEFVRKLVKDFLKKSHPHIRLGLIELGYNRGSFIGGFHVAGSNEIILNKSALRVMQEESKKEDFKAYLFHLLLHEYIHSIGVFNETKTRELTQRISLALFDSKHPVGKLCTIGLNALFPYSFHQEHFKPNRNELNPEFILLRHRDSEFTYI